MACTSVDLVCAENETSDDKAKCTRRIKILDQYFIK